MKTLYITPGSLWDNGYKESFSGSLRDELLNGETLYGLAEAKVLVEAWRCYYTPSDRIAVWAIVLWPRKRRRRHCRPPVPLRSTYARQWGGDDKALVGLLANRDAPARLGVVLP